MRFRSISFITFKIIPRQYLVIFHHQPVSRHFAIILAAAIEMLFASPLMIGTCKMSTCGIVTASLTKCPDALQIINCHTHCFISGLQNINFINSRRTCHTNPRCYRAFMISSYSISRFFSDSFLNHSDTGSYHLWAESQLLPRPDLPTSSSDLINPANVRIILVFFFKCAHCFCSCNLFFQTFLLFFSFSSSAYSCLITPSLSNG